MASLTGLAFQIDFLVGRGSRRNAVSQIRDTVDSINLIARHGANKAAKQRKQQLEQNLKELEGLSKKATENMVKQKSAAASASAAGVGKTSYALTKKIKADVSGIDKVGKKAVSVSKQMKTSFTDLNKALQARNITGLKGKSFAHEKTSLDFAGREKEERQSIVETLRTEYEQKKALNQLTEGDVRQMHAVEKLHKELIAIDAKHIKDQREIDKLKNEAHRKFREEGKQEEKQLREQIMLRQQLGQSIENMAQSVGTTMRNAFVYSTAAIAAFYYKLNAVLDTFREFEKELINAQSIFQTTNEELFSLSDEIAQFGLSYGIELQNASSGLYQMASAGLSAEESIALLNHTLRLSMAVQGDHNTISKLTTQVIFGFGMEMEDAGLLTDKFAHAINKSLIEYQDLASAVKFAMPFFVATNQSIDQLLGSIEILTNRALEAGIAGRGLRQALSEFAEGAEDSTRTFAKLGVKVVDAQGNFLQLTEIARNFKTAFGESANDVELLTTLLEDLNVRGATAFVHLVQNVDEFEEAVEDLGNAAGTSAKMAEIQQASLTNQIQILKNALMAPFLMTDKIGQSQGYMNEFHMTLHGVVQEFSDLIYSGPEGEKVLTDIGKGMKQFIIAAMRELASLLKEGMTLFKRYATDAGGAEEALHLITIPLRIMLKVLTLIGPRGIEFILIWKTLNGILPISSLITAGLTSETFALAMMQLFGIKAADGATVALTKLQMAQLGVFGAFGLMIAANLLFAKTAPRTAEAISMIAGAIMGLAVAKMVLTSADPYTAAAMAAAGIAIGYGFSKMMQKLVTPPQMETIAVPNLDLGGSGLDTGPYEEALGGQIPSFGLGGRVPAARGAHRLGWVEPGESITSKTQNMLGGASGITINIHGDVYDADNFAEAVSSVLPQALNSAADINSLAIRTSTAGPSFGKTVINRGSTIVEGV